MEVKQFDLTQEQELWLNDVEKEAVTDVPGAQRRVREKINKASKQIAAFSRGRWPALLLLFDNLPRVLASTSSYAIKTAMYGLETVDLSVSPAGGTVKAVGRRFGPRRKVGPDRNTSLSAVAVLTDSDASSARFLVYHNVHAHMPLPASWLQGSSFQHFTLPTRRQQEFEDWIEIPPR